MIDSQTSRSRFQLKTGPLIGGAVLIGAGGLLSLAWRGPGRLGADRSGAAAGEADGRAAGRAREAEVAPGQGGDRRRRLAERTVRNSAAIVVRQGATHANSAGNSKSRGSGESQEIGKKQGNGKKQRNGDEC